MKRYMYRAILTSRYNVRSLWLCADREKLAVEIERMKTDGFTASEITKSKRHYVTDGNTELHCTVLN